MKRSIPSIIVIFISFFIFFFSNPLTATSCEIGNIAVTVLDCDSSGYFNVELDFEYASAGNQGFRIQGNGTDYGDFEYENLPILIGSLLGDGETEYEFVVIDKQYEECSNWTAIDPVDCGGGNEDCFISELTIDDYPCEEGTYNVYLNFEYENVSEEGFKLYINNDLFDEFDYADLPLNIGPFNGDGETIYHFLVEDYSETCASDANFGPITCEGGGSDCFISELTIDDHPCVDGVYKVYLNFEYENVSDSGFNLLIDWEYFDSFSYEDLPLEIGYFLGDGETSYHFLVEDLGTEECASDTNFGPIFCDSTGNCNIWDVEAEVLPCDESGNFNVELDFEYVNAGNEGFRVQGNGIEHGNFSYNDLPVTLGPLIGDGTTEYEFVVIDNLHEECSDWTAIDPVDCGDGECEIWDLTVDVDSCTNGHFNVFLDFEYAHVNESGFNLFVNWDLYESFSYDDLPITVSNLEGDGETTYHFLVRDNQFEGCAEDIAIEAVDCDEESCSITDMEATILPCNENNEFEVLINFDFEHTGNDGFDINGNGNYYGSFEYSELPVVLGPFPADGIAEYEFEARDNQNNTCFDWTTIDPFMCDTSVLFTNMNMGIEECNENTYYVHIDFEVDNIEGESFTVSSNGMLQLSFSYDELPVQIGPLTNDEYISYYFIITDNSGNNHGDWVRFFPFTCESLGIDDKVSIKDYLNIYPNPSGGMIYFKNIESKNLQIEIYDLTGNRIKNFDLNQQSVYSIYLREPGLYFYRATEGATSVSGKLTIW